MSSNISVGIAGWSYPDWQGIVYTESGTDELRFVSAFVDCIEINSTFYRPPSQRNTKSWLERTSDLPGFFFTAKLHRDFTHEGKMESKTIKEFHTGFAPMLDAGKLKHLLVQFKYNFVDTKQAREHLSRIVKNFSDAFNIVVEVRDRSWQKPEALSFLDGLGVAVCNLDYPLSSKSFDMELCTVGRQGYFRMHGRNAETWFSKAGRDETYNYYYNERELSHIKSRIDRLAKAFESLTVIANNHYHGAELANAIELKAMITGKKMPVPQGLLKAYPDLERVALDA
jgi:uncharacterized protein YecE (DUF72 family)